MTDKKIITEDKFLGLKLTFDIESSLGTLTFRFITDKDTSIIEENLEENDEIFTKKFIINQLENPKISVQNLNELNDGEIKNILLEYIEQEYDFKKYFTFNNENFYSDFKKGMNNFIQFITKEKYIPVTSIYKMSKEYKTAISLTISALDTVKPVIYEMERMQNLMNQIQPTVPYETISDLINSYNINIQPITNLIQNLSSLSTLTEVLEPQIRIWDNWIKNNSQIIAINKNSIKILEELNKDYKINQKEAFKCLKKYHWFISPNMDYDLIYEVIRICEQKGNKTKSINNLFNNYFLRNRCKNLRSLVENWKSNQYFEKRMKIFRDCVKIINNSPKTANFSNLVVPTLITQIDGIQRDIMDFYDLNKYPDEIKSKLNNRKNSQETYYRTLTKDDWIYDAMNDIFLKVLFQTAYPRTGYTYPMHFSRHKILHGNNINYGRTDYSWRCFMILDFLYTLSSE